MPLTDAAKQILDKAEEVSEEEAHARAEESNGMLTLYHDAWPVRIDENYDAFITFFGYNPEHWVVETPGTMGKWQQSKGNDDGSRDIVWLYSYKGVKFRKKVDDDFLRDDDFNAALESLKNWKPLTRRTLGTGLGEPLTYVHAQGDEQGGKSEGGGISGLQTREEASIERSIAYVTQLMKNGWNITEIADLATGDKVENIYGHYESQNRTTDTLRKQDAYAVDSDVKRTEAFLDLGLPMKKAYTPSNHGEFRRTTGGPHISSASDNLDLIIADNVKRLFNRDARFADQIEWFIPHDEWITKVVLNGVPAGLTHGHKADRRKRDAWVQEQANMMLRHDDYKMRLLVMGHKHHYYSEELNGVTVIQTPSLDGGSPYFEAMMGQRAQGGLLGFLVGSSLPFGFGMVSPL